mmetsp:Transcript_13812/g.26821  ORF Transcript_13812/g.26821 Transcript_13812/m.26821 type:complete len:295 (+) Transcript_13812:176-1060(+)|eukprot:CAMPEP_0171514170 /NCGR_PEP_ID=MMETSP0959-20130129/2683_1 /TAXON_ID=87120 /ORGANISM="Aurantiochytrium limacinum, Strain ATCCMYA-1381" /LENGTH=294 /DNA_ID=CAMNT_0012052441 /DNA_START=45 /DNA_END=929 /DNA_ORIENTATION=+
MRVTALGAKQVLQRRSTPTVQILRNMSSSTTSRASGNELNVDLFEDGRLARVSFARPQRMNALSFPMGDALLNLDKNLEESVLSVVITGEGGRAFSTGRDLKDSKSHTPEQADAYMKLARDTVLAIKAMSRPTVAAVNGFAFGWGMEVALACDLRVVNKEATLCFPECGLGIFPGAMGTVLLPRLVGPAIAKDLILTSRRFLGQEAFELGVANRVAENAEQCVDIAMELAGQISNNAPLGIKGACTVIDEGLDLSFAEHAALSDKHRFPLNDTEDFKEALVAFAEGRKPSFKGR